MELLSNYSYNAYNFTIWFFRLIVLFIVSMVLLIVFFRINETVKISEGEIVAANPQEDYKSPFEAQVDKVLVKEGQQVARGDTLVILNNREKVEEFKKAKAEIEYLQKKIKSIRILANVVGSKKNAVEQSQAIAAKKYQLGINGIVNDLKSIDEQYNIQKEKLSSVNEKLYGDSILFKKDMLSKYEFNNSSEAQLDVKEGLNQTLNNKRQKAAEKNIIYNNFTREQNSHWLDKIQLQENETALEQAKNEYQTQLVQASAALVRLEGEINEQYLIAENGGRINFLYNTNKSMSFVDKGALLVSLAPVSKGFYAKVTVPEKDVRYIKPGMPAQLKMDAYHNYEIGIIRGSVTYVSERKNNEKFYALVDLSNAKQLSFKPGYTVYGEIITDEMPLYKYFMKRLFRQIEMK